MNLDFVRYEQYEDHEEVDGCTRQHQIGSILVHTVCGTEAMEFEDGPICPECDWR